MTYRQSFMNNLYQLVFML